jgi:hypothetical protein
MDRLHIESVAEDKGEALFATQVSDPVPAEQALDGDRQVLSMGDESLQQLISITGQLPVHEGFALRVQDAEIEAASVEVDTAVVKMLLGVESHRGLLSWSSQPTAYRGGRPEGTSNQYPRRSSGRKPQKARFPPLTARAINADRSDMEKDRSIIDALTALRGCSLELSKEDL